MYLASPTEQVPELRCRIDSPNSSGETAMHMAAATGMTAVVKQLVEVSYESYASYERYAFNVGVGLRCPSPPSETRR